MLGDDYDVAYESNAEVGIVKVILTGKGRYTDATERSFTINAVDVLKAAVKVCDQTWNVRRLCLQ